ncbi:MAG: HNH endonuclease [Ardenticatenaceae bacterium]|nr:HNH endonuclease [Ardenticatenaceae bacterium]
MNLPYDFVALRARHRCEYCLAPESIFNFHFELDHIIPQAKGGKHEADNLALACRSCNLYKQNLLQCIDPLTNEAAPLFHPRHDNWQIHFEADQHNGLVIGLTAIGRVTVDCLRMNSESQRNARRLWIQLNLFP